LKEFDAQLEQRRRMDAEEMEVERQDMEMERQDVEMEMVVSPTTTTDVARSVDDTTATPWLPSIAQFDLGVVEIGYGLEVERLAREHAELSRRMVWVS
jgi:hypothetical protein